MQKALDSNLNNSINEFYEFRNFMNTWSQHNNYTNLLLTGYECKPVKTAETDIRILSVDVNIKSYVRSCLLIYELVFKAIIVITFAENRCYREVTYM